MMSTGPLSEGALSALTLFQQMSGQRIDRQNEARRLDQYDRQIAADQAYRNRLLANEDRAYDFEVRQYDEGADQRQATLEGTNLANEGQELLNVGYELANQKADLEVGKTEADIIVNQYYGLDLVDPKNPNNLDRDRIAEGFRTGNKPIMDAVMTQITSQLLPKGSKAVGISALPGGPGFVVLVENADGSTGVLTEDGTSNPDSKVQEFTPERLAGLAEWGYQSGVVPNSSIDFSLLRGMESVIEAGSEGATIREESAFYRNEGNVVNSLPPKAQRVAGGAIAAANTDDERADVTDAIARDAGLTPRARTLLERRRATEERGRLGGNKDATQRRIAEIDAELAELGFTNSSEAAQLVAATENTTGQQVNTAIENGDITVTPALRSETADMLRSKGVNSLRELELLNAKEQALARAVLMSTITDDTMRRELAGTIDNLMSTQTTDMDTGEVITANQNERQLANEEARINQARDNYEISLAQLERGLLSDIRQQTQDGLNRTDAILKPLSDIQKTTTELFFDGDDFKPSEAKADEWVNLTLPKLQQYLSAIPLNEEGLPVNREQIGEFQALQSTINQGISLVLASYAEDFDLIDFFGFIPYPSGDLFNLQQLGRREAVGISSDYAGNRIGLERASNGNPKTFYFLDSEGNPTDRGVDAAEIENKNEVLYRWMVRRSRQPGSKLQGGS